MGRYKRGASGLYRITLVTAGLFALAAFAVHGEENGADKAVHMSAVFEERGFKDVRKFYRSRGDLDQDRWSCKVYRSKTHEYSIFREIGDTLYVRHPVVGKGVEFDHEIMASVPQPEDGTRPRKGPDDLAKLHEEALTRLFDLDALPWTVVHEDAEGLRSVRTEIRNEPWAAIKIWREEISPQDAPARLKKSITPLTLAATGYDAKRDYVFVHETAGDKHGELVYERIVRYNPARKTEGALSPTRWGAFEAQRILFVDRKYKDQYGPMGMTRSHLILTDEKMDASLIRRILNAYPRGAVEDLEEIERTNPRTGRTWTQFKFYMDVAHGAFVEFNERGKFRQIWLPTSVGF
jgi:hypothetical protein